MSTYTRNDTQFLSGGLNCRAWQYHPADANGAAIVMGHGLGGTRSAGLDPFAVDFAKQGYTVLLFDYRYFGSSDGEPRQLLSIHKQIQDWKNAIAHVRTLPNIDKNRIGLWGTSFSSGHVLTVAAQDANIAAVVAQNPMVDGFEASMSIVRYAGVGQLLRIAAYGLVDQIKAWLSLSPVRVPITAEPGTFAAMNSHDAHKGYQAIAPEGFRNEMTARMALVLMTYRPITMSKKIKCPVLIQACMKDTVAPASAAIKMAKKLGSLAELKQYDIGHFDIYLGAHRATALKDQNEFYNKALRLAVSD